VICDDDIDRLARPLLGDGHELHPGQRRAVHSIAGHDTLVVLPTGSGKTLVHQLASRILGGLTVLVTPTLSLQSDQLAVVRAAGARAEGLHGGVRGAGRRRVLDAADGGELDVIVVTPEQLAVDEVLDALSPADVRLLVVDEAHCVSAWGVDFRPHYLALGAVVQRLGEPRVLALTATAPPRTRVAVAEALGRPDMAVVVGNADRPEIHLAARLSTDEDATEKAMLRAIETQDPAGAVLVYAATRRRVDELHRHLVEAGHRADRYHGGLRTAEREDVLRRFRNGAARLVVATSAFGLGIDRADVRLVVHVDPPESLDELWQEIGRAGRDGEPARSLLISRPGGYGLRRYFAAAVGASSKDVRAVVAALQRAGEPMRPSRVAAEAGLSTRRSRGVLNVLVRSGAALEDRAGVRLRTAAPVDEVVRRAEELRDHLRVLQETEVDLVRRYAETDDCRRRLVLELLGEGHPEPCGRCDSCDAGQSTAATNRPFAVGAAVTHPSFGDGQVAQYEGNRVVVLFDAEGYRTLDLDLVTSEQLLVAR
jgi:ATP-dependent DNA helicase RecQ